MLTTTTDDESQEWPNDGNRRCRNGENLKRRQWNCTIVVFISQVRGFEEDREQLSCQLRDGFRENLGHLQGRNEQLYPVSEKQIITFYKEITKFCQVWDLFWLWLDVLTMKMFFLRYVFYMSQTSLAPSRFLRIDYLYAFSFLFNSYPVTCLRYVDSHF